MYKGEGEIPTIRSVSSSACADLKISRRIMNRCNERQDGKGTNGVVEFPKTVGTNGFPN